MPAKSPLSLTERFFAKVEPEPNTGCFLWSGCVNNSGYGSFAGWTSAHRFAWEMKHGPIPKGMYVLHRCDVRICVNADHLFLGTQRDNLADAKRKGRYRNGGDVNRERTHCKRGHPFDERRTSAGKRLCRVCNNAWQRAFYAAELARDPVGVRAKIRACVNASYARKKARLAQA